MGGRTLATRERARLDRSLPRRFRPDVEGLRAVAVVLVVLYHAGVPGFRGGFVGVDVFFVISGFLITSLLAHDLLEQDAYALPRFWARRVRRLLPAAALVVIAVLVCSRWLVDPLTRRSIGHDGLAVAGFAINIVLAHRQADYFAATASPSPFLHFWSLAVEEQFYLVWPAALFAVMRARRAIRLVALSTIGGLALLSLGLSVWSTSRHPTFAFYQLPSRAWELLVGAGIAMSAPVLKRISFELRSFLTVAGLLAIAIATFRFDDQTLFPGWAAMLPVAGAALVVAAGVGGYPARYAPDVQRWLGAEPMKWLGARSYALYLWHWPALVLATAHWGNGWNIRFLAVAAAIGLAVVSYALLETPVRRSEWLAHTSWRGLALGVSVCATMIVASTIVLGVQPKLDNGTAAAAVTLATVPGQTDARAADADATTSSGTDAPDTAGSVVVDETQAALDEAEQQPAELVAADTPDSAPATDAPAPVAASSLQERIDAITAEMMQANASVMEQAAKVGSVPSNLSPSITAAGGDKPVVYDDGCMLGDGDTQIPSCVYGAKGGGATLVLFGDSHAAQWFPALDGIAKAHGWKLVVLLKQGCPVADLGQANPVRNRECGPFREQAIARIAKLHPALVVMTSFRYRVSASATSAAPDGVWRDGLDRTMAALRPNAGQVLILGDTPEMSTPIPECLAGHVRSVGQCMRAKSGAVKAGREAAERQIADAHGAVFTSAGAWLCTGSVCPVILGNTLLYRDQAHITTDAAKLFQPFLDAVVTPLMQAPDESGG